MAGKSNTYSGEHKGFTMVWTARRLSVDCNIYKGGELVEELVYPKAFGANMWATHEAFKHEAAGIAERKLKARPAVGESDTGVAEGLFKFL